MARRRSRRRSASGYLWSLVNPLPQVRRAARKSGLSRWF